MIRKRCWTGQILKSCSPQFTPLKRDTLLLGDETALYADSAYSSQQTREKLAKLGIEDQVQRKGYRGKSLSKEERTRNKEIAVTRAAKVAGYAEVSP